MNNRKSKFWTIVFSLCPGAGHMYMGYINQGAQLMLLFFVICSLVGYFRLELFGFIIPVIWFYSVFDAYHLYEGSNVEELTRFNLFSWLQEHPKLLGYLLIFIGIFMLLDRILLPLIDYPWQYYIQSAIVAFILILGGIKLLTGTRIDLPLKNENKKEPSSSVTVSPIIIKPEENNGEDGEEKNESAENNMITGEGGSQ